VLIVALAGGAAVLREQRARTPEWNSSAPIAATT
jgi:hypothetical protein